MRNYAQEGWVQQLQGRIVVGHYLVAGAFSQNNATGDPFLAIRNPLIQRTGKQRHMHIIRAELMLSVDVVDDAAFPCGASFNTVHGPMTVNHGTGGSAATIANLMRSGIDSAVDAQIDTSSGLSGGTLGTTDVAFLQTRVAQAAATGTDAFKGTSALWVPTWGPLLLKGDQGVIGQTLQGPTTPGEVQVLFSIEWLESEAQ